MIKTNVQNYKMSVDVTKSTVPVLWLDTGFIWGKEGDVKFWQKLSKLVLQNKIIVVDVGQLAEMQERFSAANPFPANREQLQLLKFYKTVVGKYLATDHSSFLSSEIEIAMKSYVANSSDMIFNFNDLFDPLITALTKMIDSLGDNINASWGTARTFKKISSDIVFDWSSLRKDAKDKNQSFSDRHKQELMGFYEAIKKVSSGNNSRRKKNLVEFYLKRWKEISGDSELNSMLGFFKSEHYLKIPYVNIHSRLISDLIVGNEEPRSSDYFDIIMISMILPFANYLVTDGSMKNRISDKLKLTKPSGQYDCKIIKHSEVGDLIDSL